MGFDQGMQSFDLKSLLPAFHEMELPTNGLAYQGEIPKVLHVRGLTVKELKHLTAAGRYDKKVFDTCISGCIKELVDVSKLYLPDYNAIIFNIRVLTSGTSATAVTNCDNPECRKQFKFEYDTAEVTEVTQLEETMPQTKTIFLSRLKKDNQLDVEVEVKQLTRKDWIAVDTILRKDQQDSSKTGSSPSRYPLTELLMAHIVGYTGLPVHVPKQQFIEILSASESDEIVSAFSEFKYGITGTVKPACPFCATETVFEIPFTDLFFQ